MVREEQDLSQGLLVFSYLYLHFHYMGKKEYRVNTLLCPYFDGVNYNKIGDLKEKTIN